MLVPEMVVTVKVKSNSLKAKLFIFALVVMVHPEAITAVVRAPDQTQEVVVLPI